MRERIVVESPLKGDIRENLRYLLWCCRAVYLDGNEPIASHLICPWFMDDARGNERTDGINWSWMWNGEPHLFFTDLSVSRGMELGIERCLNLGIKHESWSLMTYDLYAFGLWQTGEWPPHTEGFEL